MYFPCWLVKVGKVLIFKFCIMAIPALLGNLISAVAGSVIQQNLDSPEAKGIVSSLAQKGISKAIKNNVNNQSKN